jgi:two-component system, chemotaxis family, protein-glutamate methylesterase/glutaminase
MSGYDFHVIGIGSSAGGIDPLKMIIAGLPADINAAIIVIQHLPVDHDSNLHLILQRVTPLNLVRVETIEYIEPGNIYVMAAGKQLQVKDRFLAIGDRFATDKVNRTIDHCFESIAQETASKAIGVILSGAGYDGLEGARAIEDKGGLVIVQDPITADFPLMPQNLIANDHPDHVLTPQQIIEKIKDVTGYH